MEAVRRLVLALALLMPLDAGATDLDFVAPPLPAADRQAALPDGLYARLGPVAIIPDAAARIFTPLGRYPGASIRIPPQVTAALDVGYYITSHWAVSATIGVPPTATIEGAGSIGNLGRLGSSTIGPVLATAHYHWTLFGALQPYVGAGPVYMAALDSRDGALDGYQLRSAWGVAAQVGADYRLGEHVGLFLDLKKAYLRTSAVASLSGLPLRADVKLDPYTVSGGLSYRF